VHFGNDKDVRHIGHAVAGEILGPYREPDSLTWLDSRIDPKLFVDDDGRLYMYMVKFTDGNTIWGRPMKDPGTFSGPPVYQFASLPNTWETMDNRVAEGPWVIKYRKNYYMMYNANHTSTQWGNYILGVAQSKTPLGFDHGSKYSYPVLQSNQFDLKDLYTDLLKYDSTDSGLFWYMTSKPTAGDWNNRPDDNAGWKQGRPGFAAEYTKGSTTRDKKTEWKTGDIWLRRNFNYDKTKHGNLALRLNHSGPSQVWLNGMLIYDSTGSRYVVVNADQHGMSAIRQGRNSIAVYSKAGTRPLIDVALFAMRSDTAKAIVYSPGQPNIVRGPNGFEWWLVYMADQTDQRRSQYVDRVHFFDKTMYVDGITGSNVSGYHPLPSAPSLGDIFDGTAIDPDKYRFLSGRLTISEGEARQTGNGAVSVLIKDVPATNYLFEAGVKPGATKAGIYAWYQDELNNLVVVFNRDQKQLEIIKKKNSVVDKRSIALPPDFNFSVYHTVRVIKNVSRFEVEIDGLKLLGASEFSSAFPGKGTPGLYSTEGTTAFDGIVFTKGFDEYDSSFQGWNQPGNQVVTGWIAGSHGIGPQSKATGSVTAPGNSLNNMVVKGDPLQNYEFGIQVNSRDTIGSAGIYPVYIDAKNYVQAKLDFAGKVLNITVMDNGKNEKQLTVPLHQARPHYSDIKYTDFAENIYSFSSSIRITGLRLSRHPFNNPDTMMNDLYTKMDIAYRSGDAWLPLTGLKKEVSGHPAFDSLSFDPVYATAIRFTNKGADNTRYQYKIWIGESNRLSYNLRARKTGNEIFFFVDGANIARVEHTFGPSRVGLFTENNNSAFNGALLYQLPAD
jgi:hypothetical protein